MPRIVARDAGAVYSVPGTLEHCCTRLSMISPTVVRRFIASIFSSRCKLRQMFISEGYIGRHAG
jgi:hypothetical protein